MALRPSSEMVALAWLKGVPGLTASNVGDTVPEDNSTWEASGFTQMHGVVGGDGGMYTPEQAPVIQVDLWANASDSGRPPWNKAHHLGALIVADTYITTLGGTGGNRDVSAHLPPGYNGAYVQSVYPVSLPRKVPADDGSYARVTFELAITWVELAS